MKGKNHNKKLSGQVTLTLENYFLYWPHISAIVCSWPRVTMVSRDPRGGSLSSLPFGWVVWEIDDEIWSPAASHLVLTVFRPDIMGSLDVANPPASVA